jgi:uncharacterized protein
MIGISELLELQACDTSIIRLKKQIDELPEAEQIKECRSKRKQLKAKQDQVFELADESENKMKSLQDEEEKVLKKIAEFQETLNSNSDYRVTQKITRDMEGQVKRQKTLAQEQNDELERQIKIDKLANSVIQMLHDLDEKEDKLTNQFKTKGAQLLQQIKELTDSRKAYFDKMDEHLAHKYERLREEKGGIALAWLEGDHCSVCHTSFLTGDLQRLKHGDNLTECPNCHRLFIVDKEA